MLDEEIELFQKEIKNLEEKRENIEASKVPLIDKVIRIKSDGLKSLINLKARKDDEQT